MWASSRVGFLACGLLLPLTTSFVPAEAQVRGAAPAASFPAAPRGFTAPTVPGSGSRGQGVRAPMGRGGVAQRSIARPGSMQAHGGAVAGRHPSGPHHRDGRRYGYRPGVLFAPPYVPYGYDQFAVPPDARQQVIVQPVVTQTQIVTQAPAYDPVYVRCSGPRIIEVAPTRGRMKTPRVIYGTPDPCQRSATAGTGIRAAY